MVLTVSFVLSPVTGLFCHRRQRIAPPTCRQRRGGRTTRLRRTRFSIIRPRAVARLVLPRPLHPVPNVRDDRDTPLSRDGTMRILELIWVSQKRDSFCKRGWTAKSVICPSGRITPRLWSCMGRVLNNFAQCESPLCDAFGLNADIGVGPRSAKSRIRYSFTQLI
jgi:hypothetical protein